MVNPRGGADYRDDSDFVDDVARQHPVVAAATGFRSGGCMALLPGDDGGQPSRSSSPCVRVVVVVESSVYGLFSLLGELVVREGERRSRNSWLHYHYYYYYYYYFLNLEINTEGFFAPVWLFLS